MRIVQPALDPPTHICMHTKQQLFDARVIILSLCVGVQIYGQVADTN